MGCFSSRLEHTEDALIRRYNDTDDPAEADWLLEQIAVLQCVMLYGNREGEGEDAADASRLEE